MRGKKGLKDTKIHQEKKLQVKRDYPACFSVALNGKRGVGMRGLPWQQQVLEQKDASLRRGGGV